ncbi:MAG: type II toxin-antitoxin system HicA family toxin [Candidatus Sungbacteria bacterium]|nr:type II toxin-antitoxin system HicA family toxin [Candidatus Sungbacteria bacterium]
MPKLPQISGKEMGRVLARLGFIFKSQKGSHMKFIRLHDGAKEIIVVPNHKTLRKGTFSGILKQLNITFEKLRELM